MNAAIGLTVAFTVLAAFMIAWGFRDRVIDEVRRGWRIVHVNGGVTYEERIEGVWVSIPFEPKSDVRESPIVINVHRPEKWAMYPKWAAERRGEILARVRSELKMPHYVIEEA